MEYEFYVAKLNLSPKVINVYAHEKNDIEGMKQLKNVVVTNELESLFQTGEDKFTNTQIKKYIHTQENMKQKIKDSDIYADFVKAQNDLLNGYSMVVEESQKNDGIYWPNEFLNETKPKMKQKLYALKKEFPILEQAVLNTKDDVVKNNIPGNNNFGHGRKYLLDSEKIKLFLDSNDFDGNYSFYYDMEKERIWVSCEKEEYLFKRIISDIQEKINENGGNIGTVHIILIYKKLKIDNSYKIVTFEVVYPNNPERTDSIERVLDPPFKASRANKIDVKFYSDKKKFTGDTISKLAENFFGAKNGYLKTVKSGQKDIFKGTVKRIRIKDNGEKERDE
ncbi:MAG: hypothetical protein LKI22_12065 [Liquorilactobacillus nagelii]|jgi:hypothetical protein|uniref:hypothetical protein n=1 Tax=Liquorilactobacillus nagelii TaxID=82688 RepID=UPI002430BDB4|nr:hypothetical protein [Liquorilactobacillus nagelii]MCI1634554.1 hypothetical protein [Liquorilactobacillus nagelii]